MVECSVKVRTKKFVCEGRFAYDEEIKDVAPKKPALAKLPAALEEAYGERVERVALYGARARGDDRPGSDYDIADFLRDLRDHAAEMKKVEEIGTDILYDTCEAIHAMPFRAGAYADPRMPLMYEIRCEGLDF